MRLHTISIQGLLLSSIVLSETQYYQGKLPISCLSGFPFLSLVQCRCSLNVLLKIQCWYLHWCVFSTGPVGGCCFLTSHCRFPKTKYNTIKRHMKLYVIRHIICATLKPGYIFFHWQFFCTWLSALSSPWHLPLLLVFLNNSSTFLYLSSLCSSLPMILSSTPSQLIILIIFY